MTPKEITMEGRVQKKKRRPPRAGETALMRRDGALALIFVNTVLGGPLSEYADLVAWSRKEAALSSAEAARLLAVAAGNPEEAATAFHHAQELCVLLAKIFNALAEERRPEQQNIDKLNGYLRGSVARPEIVRAQDGQGWVLGDAGEASLERLLRPLVSSAAQVLVSGKVGRCGREDCGLLFLRRNPGPPRKWCGEVCAHRARRRRHYEATEKPYKAGVREFAASYFEGKAKAKAGRT